MSSRLLVLTMAFVMLSEVLIYLPSIARFRMDYLAQRISAAHLATLALEATPGHMIGDALRVELLHHAAAYAIIIARPGDVRRVLAGDMPPAANALYDLRATSILDAIGDSLMTLAEGDGRVLRVVGASPKDERVVVEVLLDEAPLRQAMIAYSWRILQLSVIISLVTAALVYLSLQWLMVRPLRRIADNMVAFREAPEDPARVIRPTARGDEIGTAQRELAAMEEGLRAALGQQARLAALGIAVAKINHDLRNALSAARLVSDQLGSSADPKVRRLAPTLATAIDRAIALCSETLDYVRSGPPAPLRSRFKLAELVGEAGGIIGLLTEGRAEWRNQVPADLQLEADRDQLLRVFVNLGRNAVEAGAKEIRIAADHRPESGRLAIELADNGPGLPAKAREKLFTPFAGSAKAGGTGLGLAISREIARAHDGDLELAQTSSAGTVFRIVLPAAAAEHGRAAE